MTIRVWIAAAAMALAGGAAAQEQGFAAPCPGGTDANCDQFPAQLQAADPAAMASLVGVWEGQMMLPGAPGYYPDTPAQVRVTNRPDGTFSIDYYACFQPYGLQPSCAQSFRYGQWAAHPTGDGWIAVAVMSSGSSFSGAELGTECGLNHVRLADARTMVDQQGIPLYRTQ